MFKRKNKKGVFGLTAVQSFFAVILGVALLAYIIVVIMGVLGGTSILPISSATAVNESVSRASILTGATLTANTLAGGSCGAITAVNNGTVGGTIPTTDFSQVGCVITNTSTMINFTATSFLINYPYTLNSVGQNNLNNILTNTSSGISGFFGAINPVYAILAVLVIILILVVLVRVVQGGSTGRQEQL